MIAKIGQLSIFLALISAICALVLSALYSKKIYFITDDKVKLASIMQFLFILFSYFLLTYSYVISDFSIINVWQNSHTAKPLVYKITGVWGNHEGSILLWVLILTFMSFLISIFSQEMNKSLKVRVLGIQSIVTIAFLLFVILTSNPFLTQFPTPLNGLGLNPVLQDPGLIIHPPFLYLGYVGFSIVFSFGVAGLLENCIDSKWARWVYPWTIISWSSLTIGITIGSWWAYYELGWGGWWFWDPVENVSLLPWLTGTALVHSMMVVRNINSLKSWTILLSIMTFLFSLLGTFLVRSGILVSVHSFAVDPRRGLFMLFILSFFTISSLVIFAIKSPKPDYHIEYRKLGREGLIILNNLLLVVLCSVVFVGTLYPLLLETVSGIKISVGPPYFNITFLPFAFILMFFVPIGPFLNWKKTDLSKLINLILLALIVNGVLFILLYAFIHEKGPTLAPFSIALGLWLIAGSFVAIIKRFNLSEKGVIKNIARIKLLKIGSSLAHAGLGVLIVGVTIVTAYEIKTDRVFELHQKIKLADFQIQYNGISPNIGKNYDEIVANFLIFKSEDKIGSTSSTKRFYRSQDTMTTEAGIYRHFFSHIYITLSDINEEYIVATISYKPFVRLIWLGGFLMAFGGLVSLVDSKGRLRS
ncbi:MAG: heme lyase CcmF/NrfE family subunit [Alphaproteobacteria bacterium]|jgi:cytochrome c-type biogenesis protein CcmF|tara:strand:- start:62035 stop:63966 length:1932 start_codon:yes stop_codon:yes gene_type:complete